MASLGDRVWAVTRSLIAMVGFTTAVSATDITRQAEVLHKDFAEYTTREIANKIADEIKRNHDAGISGSL